MASKGKSNVRPKAIKRPDWFFEEADNEVLAYDPEHHRVHCLNATALSIWKLCSGTRTVKQIAADVDIALDPASRELVVSDAIRRMARVGLIAAGDGAAPDMSRRALIKKIGVGAAAALPLITSIVAPTPAHAATCLSAGSPQCPSNACGCPKKGTGCSCSSPGQCCTNASCSGSPLRCS